MGATPTQMFRRVLIPTALLTLFSGLRIAMPVALIITVITEIIGESRGLGNFISFQSASYEYARAMAAVVVVGIIGFALNRLLVVLRRRLIF
jgi:ABC-type nitrate/sulfonate/bicarbonate transport system permease component